MPNYNKCSFMGNLTRDIELRVTPKGTAVGQFSLAINRKWRDESGADHEEATFLDFEAWGKTAETLAKYLHKGSPLFVVARAKVDKWEDKETHQPRSRVKFVVDEFQFLGGRQEDRGQREPEPSEEPPRRAAPAGGRADPRPAAQENLDEDVPF